MNSGSYTLGRSSVLTGLARSLRDAGLVLMPVDAAAEIPSHGDGVGYLEVSCSRRRRVV